jgi:hypothetical protein
MGEAGIVADRDGVDVKLARESAVRHGPETMRKSPPPSVSITVTHGQR